MTARALMIQGTGSSVGKSLLVAGLCRLARRRGIRVAPFKPQNMSNNAAVCADGGEIGRAQALQARAAGLEPRHDFNPVLLKPQTDRGAQVVVHGRVIGTFDAAQYRDVRARVRGSVLQSFQRLAAEHDLLLIEGAGSPAEVNLRTGDIANMGFARAAGVPVCVVGDIDRGGVIAALVGTHAVLDPEDAALVVGFLVNRFRGDPALFREGIETVERRTGWHCFGLVHWLSAAGRLPSEDAASIARDSGRHVAGDREPGAGHEAATDANADAGPGVSAERLRIVAPVLSRMANFDDADPLRFDPGVDFAFVPPGRALPRNVDAVLLFGTKSTVGELAFLRAQGWDHDIIAHARAGGRVLGVCGGYQMLGRRVLDPAGRDGPAGTADGLGLLDVETTMAGEKTVRRVYGRCALGGEAVSGYEIHMGLTQGPDLARPMLQLDTGAEGARDGSGLIEGTSLHGLFANDGWRAAWLARAGGATDAFWRYDGMIDRALDDIATDLSEMLDVDALFAAARKPTL
jgi:adenosylcobyric acid synthase